MNIENLLYDEIETQFDKLRTLEAGSDEQRGAVDNLVKLIDRAIEMEKIDNDCKDKVEARESDKQMKLQQMKEDRLDRMVKNILTGLGIAIPTGVTIWGTIKTFEFEKEGTITTIFGRGFIQKMLPKK